MRTTLFVLVAAGLIGLWGCGNTILLHIYTVEDASGGHSISKTPPDLSHLTPLAGVRFFFYPNASDSVIHLVPERDLVTDMRGTITYSEMVSPASNRTGALIAMREGYAVDTVYFPFSQGDTINILVRLRPDDGGFR